MRLTRAERAEKMREYIAAEMARCGVLPTQRDVLGAVGGSAALALELLAEFRRAQKGSDVRDEACREALRILIPVLLRAAQWERPIRLSDEERESLIRLYNMLQSGGGRG